MKLCPVLSWAGALSPAVLLQVKGAILEWVALQPPRRGTEGPRGLIALHGFGML